MKRKQEYVDSTCVIGPAAYRLVHPVNVLVTGRVGMGKTKTATDVLLHVIIPQVDRVIFVCPTYWTQKSFRDFDFYINPKTDVFTDPDDNVFKKIMKGILRVNEDRVRKGEEILKTAIFIDDLQGNRCIHGGRTGTWFSRLSVQCRWLGVSCIVCAQQATAVTPSFRDNVTAVVAHPSQRMGEKSWLISEYSNGSYTKEQMCKLIEKAWRGLHSRGDDEWGQHFLFIHAKSREKLRYFADFGDELTIKPVAKKRRIQ